MGTVPSPPSPLTPPSFPEGASPVHHSVLLRLSITGRCCYLHHTRPPSAKRVMAKLTGTLLDMRVKQRTQGRRRWPVSVAETPGCPDAQVSSHTPFLLLLQLSELFLWLAAKDPAIGLQFAQAVLQVGLRKKPTPSFQRSAACCVVRCGLGSPVCGKLVTQAVPSWDTPVSAHGLQAAQAGPHASGCHTTAELVTLFY